jgi:hypothetical protein
LPIPLLIWGGVAVVSAFGAKKGYDGISDLNEAEAIGKNAKREHELEVRCTENARHETAERAAQYGSHLVKLSDTTFSELRALLEALEKKAKVREWELPSGVSVSFATLHQFRREVLDPPADFAAAFSAMGAGVAASSGATGLVALFGTASTGTAISTLGGAAATNATLAWLGGGSLAAGGGGMAAGAAVLGGIMVAPALLIGGFVLAGKGERALTQAHEYRRQVRLAIENLTTLRAFLRGVNVRVDELKTLTNALAERLRDSMHDIDPDEFDVDSDEDIEALQHALLLARALGDVMATPILDASGGLTPASRNVQVKYRPLAEGES